MIHLCNVEMFCHRVTNSITIQMDVRWEKIQIILFNVTSFYHSLLFLVIITQIILTFYDRNIKITNYSGKKTNQDLHKILNRRYGCAIY